MKNCTKYKNIKKKTNKGHRIVRVPYDGHLPMIFDGEEFTMGARAWTQLKTNQQNKNRKQKKQRREGSFFFLVV